MNSVVFGALARIIFVLMLAVSLYVLYRGHNEPGGGFVGGLIAASAFAVLALADGIETARRAIRVEPMVLIGVGLLAAILSGLLGLLADGSYLTHLWFHSGDFHIGTTLLFDVGVYLVVLGGVIAITLRFYEGL